MPCPAHRAEREQPVRLFAFVPELFFMLTLDHDADHSPMFVFADGARFGELNPIPDLSYIPLVMRLELGHTPKNFFVDRMNHRPLDGNHHRLVHFIADDVAVPFTSMLLAFLRSEERRVGKECRSR